MIVHDVEQGGEGWMKLRLGIPTSSQFDRIITPARLNSSSAQKKYRAELLAEWLLGQPAEWGSSGWVERGTDLEGEARDYYAFERGVDVEQVGFISTDNGLVGCSPDGLVGDAGGLEIKCLSAANHVLAMLGESDDYKGQIQGSLWLTGREWWDLCFYNPDLPPVIRRIEPDPEWQEAFEPEIEAFVERLEADKERLAEHRVTRPWDEGERGELEIDELRQKARRLTDDPEQVEEIELLAHDGKTDGLREIIRDMEGAA